MVPAEKGVARRGIVNIFQCSYTCQYFGGPPATGIHDDNPPPPTLARCFTHANIAHSP